MSEVTAGSMDRGYMRDLVSGVWRLTGEVTDNLFDRVIFTARVLVGASVARIEDMADSINPMSAQEILDSDARKHIGSMAVGRDLDIPEGFIRSNRARA